MRVKKVKVRVKSKRLKVNMRLKHMPAPATPEEEASVAFVPETPKTPSAPIMPEVHTSPVLPRHDVHPLLSIAEQKAQAELNKHKEPFTTKLRKETKKRLNHLVAETNWNKDDLVDHLLNLAMDGVTIES